jgi:tripartite-type tricarboxylate transporter receptor subunit TctC
LTCLFLAGIAGLAYAQQAYPNRPVKIIAPQAPGGGVDLVARIIGDRLGRSLGQSFYIENQAGAGGAIATQATARAAPDGYTLMIGYVATHATNPAVKKVPYDAVKDFTPIAMIGGTPNVLVVRPSLPVKTLAEFVAYAQKNPQGVNYGTSGKGTLNHLAMEQFKNAAKFESLSVPYRSIGQAFTDLMAGQVQAIFPGVAAAMPHVKSGAVRPLAVTGPRRHPLLPDVPHVRRSRLPRIRCADVVRHRGACTTSGGDPAPAQCRDQRDAGHAGVARKTLRRSARPDADDAGAIRQVHRVGDRALDPGRPRQRHRVGLSPR